MKRVGRGQRGKMMEEAYLDEDLLRAAVSEDKLAEGGEEAGVAHRVLVVGENVAGRPRLHKVPHNLRGNE